MREETLGYISQQFDHKKEDIDLIHWLFSGEYGESLMSLVVIKNSISAYFLPEYTGHPRHSQEVR